MDWVRPAIGMTTDYEVAGWASAKFGYVAWTGELRVQPGNESGAHITEWAEKARRPPLPSWLTPLWRDCAFLCPSNVWYQPVL